MKLMEGFVRELEFTGEKNVITPEKTGCVRQTRALALRAKAWSPYMQVKTDQRRKKEWMINSERWQI